MSIFRSSPAEISSSLRRLTPHESKSFLRRAKFYGNPVVINQQPFTLNSKYLEKITLVPAYLTTLAGLELALTPVFTAGDYTATLAFIRSERQTITAAYYLDHTLGFWCYLPDYLTSSSTSSSLIDRPGKGYHLESLRLPAILQITLNQLLAQPSLQLSPASALFSFAGTAKHYRSHADFLEALRAGSLSGQPYYTNVRPKPLLRLDAELPADDPANLILSGPTAPDFSTLQKSAYHTATIFSSEVTVDLCDSQDGKLQYNFCRTADEPTRAWLSAVEAKSAITPLALPSDWVALGSFGTPLYLDALHAGDRGDLTDRRHGHYLNMWTKYLSQAPFLQDYLQALDS